MQQQPNFYLPRKTALGACPNEIVRSMGWSSPMLNRVNAARWRLHVVCNFEKSGLGAWDQRCQGRVDLASVFPPPTSEASARPMAQAWPKTFNVRHNLMGGQILQMLLTRLRNIQLNEPQMQALVTKPTAMQYDPDRARWLCALGFAFLELEHPSGRDEWREVVDFFELTKDSLNVYFHDQTVRCYRITD